MFYIQAEAQRQVMEELGRDNYLGSSLGTNNRGISIKSLAMKKLENHASTISLTVNWQKQGLDYTQYDRWQKFWSDVK